MTENVCETDGNRRMKAAATRRAGAIKRHLVIRDEATGKQVNVQVSEGNTFKASDLKPLGVRTYDPGYTNTAAVKSSISYIDGGKVSLDSGRARSFASFLPNAPPNPLSYLLSRASTLTPLSSRRTTLAGHPEVPRVPHRGARGRSLVSRRGPPRSLRRAPQPEAERGVGEPDHAERGHSQGN